ncbi:MAG: hypothetical protein ABIJ96_14200 [Elusimicrobiota bacterium]
MISHQLRVLFTAGLLSVLASSAYAQQVFLERMWVHDRGKNCAATATNDQFNCWSGIPGTAPIEPVNHGNISNDPRIEFDTTVDPACEALPLGMLPTGDDHNNVCNNSVALCTQVGYANQQDAGATPFALDFISFELFKFTEGANPLDAGSTPPLRTFFVDNPGIIPGGQNSSTLPLVPVCVIWDGDINIKGEFGKSNGQYGFRATVATNQTGASGNINITQTRAYPGGFTKDRNDNEVDQKPIKVDVVNVHVVRTSPTVVGSLTGVAAQPYNITYRLAKDATTYVKIHQGSGDTVRTIVPGSARVGEGIPDGTLQNGDSWNGRFDNGALGPPGVYLASIQGVGVDQFGLDLSQAVTRQVSLDTLLITDLRTQSLTAQSTSLAVLSYMLTEPATAYVDIYPPGTYFENGLNNLNQMQDARPIANGGSAEEQALYNAGVRKYFAPRLNGNPVLPVRHFVEQKEFRKSVITFWDGRDTNGLVQPDGDYVFVVYAALPSQNGFDYVDGSRRIWSSNARSGFLTISRGQVTISQVGPSSTVVGSSPPVAGLNPFSFTYSLSREAFVSLRILDHTGTRLVKTLVENQVRPGNFLNRESWTMPTDNDGLYVSSGNYLVQLTAQDPFFPAKVSTTSALFPVNLFRITDVLTSPLLTGTTDVVTITYQLTQPMNVQWNIYQPGTVISGSSTTWPPCARMTAGSCSQITNGSANALPIATVKGLRPERLRITEFWDGRDGDGLFVPDGNYVYTLTAQSTTTPKYFAADKVFGTLTVARGSIVFPIFNITPTFPTLFNSSQTISLPPYEVDYSLTRQSSVTIQVLSTDFSPRVVRTLISGQVRDAHTLNREFWDARDNNGNFVSAGFYTVRAVADDLASVLSSGSTAQQTVSADPLRIYDVAISPLRADFGTALVAYQVSETMKVAIKIYKPGTIFDPNGNPTPPETLSLIKRIVGVRAARTEISENWDGTDETMSLVTDGNYLFKIVASTDINSINSVTGDVVPGAALAEDLVIAEIPVVRGGSAAPAEDFINNTFVYPNPLRSSTAKFRIYVPLQSIVSMKIYNIVGELVMNKDFGERAADSYVEFTWDKSNDAGRPLAHGMYFYIVQQKSNKGDSQLFQTVKKFIIP